MKPTATVHKLFFLLLTTTLCAVLFCSPCTVLAQVAVESEPEFFMAIQILESQQQAILDSITKVRELQLGNMIILHPMDQAWDLTLIEEAIRTADNLGLYVIFETYSFLDIDLQASLFPEQSTLYASHEVIISPEQFSELQSKYPHLLGILGKEITGKQSDLNVWLNGTSELVETRLEAEAAVINNVTSTLELADFKESGAQIFLQENVISYVSANTSYCDVLISKIFNAPNTELMIGLARGMANSYGIPAWGLWVDTWRGLETPPAFSPTDVKDALYEGWFYGAKYFFFEQGNFLGTFNRDWPDKYIILDENGELTEYGKVIQEFYRFLQNEKNLDYNQPDYHSSIAVMVGQGGWTSRGKDWGIWEQSGRQGDFDFTLLNLFFPGIGNNWLIGDAVNGKEFTGLPFGMVDVISIYAPVSVLQQYDVIIALGWSQISDSIASDIEEYVESGGVFFSFLTFTHSQENIDNLESPLAWTTGLASLFGIQVDFYPTVGTDNFLHSIAFTQDTFWYRWNGKTYNYSDSGDDEYWFLKFNYDLLDSENTRVLAWIDGVQIDSNAFVVENKKGAGYTYIFNTRDSNSLPDGVLTDVLTDFVCYLCAYYVRPMVFAPYPEIEYWLSQGQANRTVHLMHDNSTTTQSFTYYVKGSDADLIADTDYLVFDYFNKEFYGIVSGTLVPLNVTLQSTQAKLFAFLEFDGTPQVLCSDAILTEAPFFVDNQLTVSLSGVEQTQNVTQIYCAELGRPHYVLGTPFNLVNGYISENILSVASDSDLLIGWELATDVYVAESSFSLKEVSWNSTTKTLNVSADGTIGQQASIKVQTAGTQPYYLKVNGQETSAWSYDAQTGLLSIDFVFTSDSVELVFGFSPIVVDGFVVSDERADVGNVQSVSFHVSWMPNDSDLAGATVTVNGTEYVTNQTGWITFNTTSDVVGKVAWNVTDIEYDGLTDYISPARVPSIIWDRVNVVDSAIFDDVVQVASLQTVWLKAEYAYNSVVFDDSHGTIFLDGEPMVWSSQNSRWEYNVTSNVVGLQEYEATSVDDQSFGLTTIYSKAPNMAITWDEIQVARTEFETSTLGVTTAKVTVAYAYTKNPVTGATVSVNDKPCSETAQGTYTCKLDDWSPLQNFHVTAETVDFDQTTTNVLNLHLMNSLLFLAIGAVIVAVAFFVLRKKRSQQHETAASP